MLTLKDYNVKKLAGVLGRHVDTELVPKQILIAQTGFSLEVYEKKPNGTTGELLLYAIAENVTMCPYLGTKFSEVPGYESGYGCPVCKGLSYHLPMDEELCDQCHKPKQNHGLMNTEDCTVMSMFKVAAGQNKCALCCQAKCDHILITTYKTNVGLLKTITLVQDGVAVGTATGIFPVKDRPEYVELAGQRLLPWARHYDLWLQSTVVEKVVGA